MSLSKWPPDGQFGFFGIWTLQVAWFPDLNSSLLWNFNFICMLFVAMGQSQLIFRDVTMQMTILAVFGAVNRDHQQYPLSLVVSSGNADLALKLGRNGLATHIMNWNMIFLYSNVTCFHDIASGLIYFSYCDYPQFSIVWKQQLYPVQRFSDCSLKFNDAHIHQCTVSSFHQVLPVARLCGFLGIWPLGNRLLSVMFIKVEICFVTKMYLEMFD